MLNEPPFEIHSYNTGRYYDTEQTLKWVVLKTIPDPIFPETDYSHVVAMIDQSRHLAYELIISMSAYRFPLGGEVLKEYDRTTRTYSDYLSNEDVKTYFNIDRI